MRRALQLVPLAGLLAVAPWAAGPASAQTAVVVGTVVDSAGAPLQGATVLAIGPASDTVAATETGVAGRYALALSAGAPYVVLATAVGHETVRRQLRLAVGQRVTLDFTLGTRPIALPSLEVRTEPQPIFSPTRTGALTVIEERAVRTVPTISRNVLELAELSPMVEVRGGAIAIAGQNDRFNDIRIDGAAARDILGLSPTGIPGGRARAKAIPIQAVREYQVRVAPYDVRQSGFTGGQLRVVTQQGTGAWHGAVAGQYREGTYTGTTDGLIGPRPDHSTTLGAFSVSGPVVRDRLHLFAAGELEHRLRPTPGYNAGSADPVATGVLADSLRRFDGILRFLHDQQPGTSRRYTLENPLANLFVRADWLMSPRHRLITRYNMISAEEELAPNRFATGAYELASNAMLAESRTHAAYVQLLSQEEARRTNDLTLSVQLTGDRLRALSDFPQVEVTITSEVDSSLIARDVRAGANTLAQANEQDQILVQLSEDYTVEHDDHRTTLGADVEYFGVDYTLIPSERGFWRFGSLTDLEMDYGLSYERTLLDPGADPSVHLALVQAGGFVQDEWRVNDRWTLTGGLRVDVPFLPWQPEYSRETALAIGERTDRIPGGRPLFSPRLGANWQAPWALRTQVRGGIGIFTGRPPLVWLAGAFANNGARTSILSCVEDADRDTPNPVPAFDPEDPPDECLFTSVFGDGRRRVVNVVGDDFDFPQDFKASLAVDQQLPGGWVVSGEVLFRRALRQVAVEDINLGESVPEVYPGYGVRTWFGDPLGQPGRRLEGFAQVIRIGSEARNTGLAASVELQKRFGERIDVRAAYSYTRATDVRSLLYADPTLNYGATAIAGDPADPALAYSAFDRPHKLLASAWARVLDWGDGVDLSLLYVGQSGRPYSYVYAFDLNADGYPGPGVADAYNDLLYVPFGLSEIEASPATAGLLMSLIAQEDCLRESQGYIIQRNGCRAPWSNRFDARLSVGIPVAGGTVRVVGVLLNVLNALNGEWGLVQEAPPLVPILDTALGGCDRLGENCFLTYDYVGPRKRTPAGTRAEPPYLPLLPESSWRAQLGVAFEF